MRKLLGGSGANKIDCCVFALRSIGRSEAWYMVLVYRGLFFATLGLMSFLHVAQGTLLSRDLARHISRIPPSALPLGFLEDAELQGSAAEIMRRHSMASLMRRYSALLRAHLDHSRVQLAKQELVAAEERKHLEVRMVETTSLWQLRFFRRPGHRFYLFARFV